MEISKDQFIPPSHRLSFFSPLPLPVCLHSMLLRSFSCSPTFSNNQVEKKIEMGLRWGVGASELAETSPIKLGQGKCSASATSIACLDRRGVSFDQLSGGHDGAN